MHGLAESKPDSSECARSSQLWLAAQYSGLLSKLLAVLFCRACIGCYLVAGIL